MSKNAEKTDFFTEFTSVVLILIWGRFQDFRSSVSPVWVLLLFPRPTALPSAECMMHLKNGVLWFLGGFNMWHAHLQTTSGAGSASGSPSSSSGSSPASSATSPRRSAAQSASRTASPQSRLLPWEQVYQVDWRVVLVRVLRRFELSCSLLACVLVCSS